MKPKSILRAFLLIASSTLLAAPSLHAITLTWDGNAAVALQTDGLGAWLGTDQWWNPLTNTNTTWTSTDSAIFGNGGAGGAVSLASPTTVGSLTFNYFTGTYTLGTAGQTITLNSGINKKAGSGIVNFASNITLSADQTWTNNSTTNLTNATGTRTLDNGGFNLTFDGTGSFNMVTSAGNTLAITGMGGIIKNGTGHVTLDSNPTIAHSFTGDIVVNGGSIGFQTSAFLTGNNTKLTDGYLGGRFNSGFTWTGGLGTGNDQIQITGGTSGFSGEGTTNSAFQIGTALSTLKWGATGVNGATGYFNPTVFLANGDARMNNNGIGSLNNGIDLNGATRTITSLQTTNGAATSGFTVSGAIINTAGTAAGLTKTGIGNLILNAANTYNGATTINAGSITLSSATAAINSTSALNLGGGTLRLVNTAQVNRVADVAVTSNGGGISYENTSGATNYTETIGSLGLVSGQTNLVLLNDQLSTGSQKLTIDTGGISRTGASNTSSITFSAGGTGLNATKNMIFVTGAGTTSSWVSGASSNPIIGPWATTGTTAALQTDYAVYNGDYVVAANTAASAETDWTTSTLSYTNNTAAVALSGNRTMDALRNTAATATITPSTESPASPWPPTVF